MYTPVQSTTQDHLEIEDITENLLILKDGSAAFVVETSAVNFGLLSEEEQDATIYAYAALLNSLSFPIQILVRSQKKDVSSYLEIVSEQEKRQKNPTLKQRLKSYRQFVETIVKERNVLDKKFYVVIPFSNVELGAAKSLASSLKKPERLPFSKEYVIEKATHNLEPRRDHLMRQFSRLGLQTRQLSSQELIQLFYVIYNPEAKTGLKFARSSDYTIPLVQPAIATNPAPLNESSSPQPAPSPTDSPASSPEPPDIFETHQIQELPSHPSPSSPPPSDQPPLDSSQTIDAETTPTVSPPTAKKTVLFSRQPQDQKPPSPSFIPPQEEAT